MWSKEGLKEKTVDIRQDLLRPELWEKWERMSSWKRSKSDHMKNFNSITHEHYGRIFSLTRRTKNLRKQLRMRVKIWKHQCILPCLVKFWKKSESGSSNIIKTKLASVNLQGSVWENHHQNYHEDHVAGKGKIHYNVTIWFTNLCLCLKLWKFLQQRQHWTRNVRNWKRFLEPDESQKWERGNRWSKDVGRYSSFCIIDGHMSSQQCQIGGKAPKIQRSSCSPICHCDR